MLCDLCGKNPAALHMTSFINGAKLERHLCPECAAKQGIDSMNINLGNLFAGFLNMQAAAQEEIQCISCGMTFSKLKKTGRLGCPTCYESLREQLLPVLEGIHGHSTHKEEMTLNSGGIESDIEVLRRQLEEAVKREEYEMAAELRDQIKLMIEEGGA